MMIVTKFLRFSAIFTLALIPFFGFSNDIEHSDHTTETTATSNDGVIESRKKDVKEFINHHLLDAHDFTFLSYKDDSGKDVYVGFRSEEHTSELQSRENLVCRLLLEKKNKSRT